MKFLSAIMLTAVLPATPCAARQHAPTTRFEANARSYPSPFKTQLKAPALAVTQQTEPAPARAAEVLEAIPARGAIVFSDNYSTDVGYYEIPTVGSESNFTLLNATDYCLANAGSLYFDGKIFNASAETDQYTGRSVSYYILDAETYELTGMGVVTDGNFKAFSMVQDPTTGTCYGSFRNEGTGTSYFGTFSTSTFSAKRITNYSEPLNFNALGITTDGTLYGIDFGGDFYTIDKATGNATLIAHTGIVSEYSSSGAVNPRNNLFYYVTSCTAGSAMYQITPATGAAVKVYDIADNDEILGLYFPVGHTSADSPDYPQHLIASFEGASLSGTVSFTMPSALMSGLPAEGEGTYTLFIDNRISATDTAPFGSEVAVPVTVSTPGMHSFSIMASNASGDSPRATTRVFVGADTPLPPTAVTLTYADGTASLAWQPSKSANNGYLDGLTYTVTRLPDNAVVAEGLTECTFSERFDAPADGLVSLGYTVTAHTAAESTQGVISNRITLGTVTPPYSNAMTNEALASAFTVINNNHDRNTWEWDSRGFFGCYYNYDHIAPDDYLVLPGANLEKGKVYTFSFEAYGFDTSRYSERVAAYVGTAPTAEALTTCVVEPTEIEGGNRLLLTGNFRAPDNGVYYFAIHCCSDADNFVLFADNVAISAPLATSAPGVVTDLKAAPHINGALEATISFLAPAVDLDGNPLSSLTSVEVRSGNRLIAKITDGITPGTPLACTDTQATEGINTYTIVAYNADGSGEAATISCFVGFAAPSRPDWFKARPGANHGAVAMTWAPVTTDVNGLIFNPGDITYTLVYYQDNTPVIIAEGISECTYEHQALQPDEEQELYQYAVFPINPNGIDGIGITDEMIPVGAPYTLPFAESFPGGYMSHTFGMTYDGAQWWLGTDNDFPGKLTAQDGDNGFAVFGSNDLLTSSRLISARIDLTASTQATLSFWHYCFGDYDNNSIQVYVNEGDEWIPLGNPVVMGQGTPGQWNLVQLPLDDYCGSVVHFCFDGKINTVAYSFIDNIMVSDPSGITSPCADTDSYTSVRTLAGGILQVTAPAATPVTICDIQGRTIATGTTSASGTLQFHLLPGLCIVRTPYESHKVSLR